MSAGIFLWFPGPPLALAREGRMRLRTIAMFGILASVLGTACGGSAPPVSVGGMSVAVTPHTASVTPGGSLQFTASLTGASAGQSTTVNWSVRETGGGNVDYLGHYVAPATTGTVHAARQHVERSGGCGGNVVAQVVDVAPATTGTFHVLATSV